MPNSRPFPSLPRLHRHIKEKHLAASAKSIYPNQKSRNFYKYVLPPNSTPSSQNNDPNGMQPPQVISGGQLVHYPFGMHPNAVPANMNNGGPPGPGEQRINGEGHYSQSHQQQATSQPHVNGHNGPQAVQQQSGQSQQQQQPSSSHGLPVPVQPPIPHIADPGRTVVHLNRTLEPVFVAAPNSVHVKRVLHSEAYLRYIESMSNQRQRTVSKYDRHLNANPRNTGGPPRAVPAHWIRDARNRPQVREEEVVRALWRLRGQLLESTVNVDRDYIGAL